MPDLVVPASFRDDPIWADPARVGFYLDLQFRADPGGLIRFSERDAELWWNTTRRQVRQFVDWAVAKRLLDRTPGQLKLNQYWGVFEVRAAQPEMAKAAQTDPVVPQPRAPEKTSTPAQPVLAKAAQPKLKKKAVPQIELPGLPPPEQKDPPALQQLMEALHKVGLHEAPNFTGKVWAKQAVCMRRMIEEHGAPATLSAIQGLRHCWPFSAPEQRSFDAYMVEKRFAEAVAEGDRRQKEIAQDQTRKAAADQTRQTRQELEAAHTAALEAWRARVWPYYLELSPAESKKIKEQAKERARVSFGREPPQRLVDQFALTIYAESVGDPPPPRPVLQ